jgi:signal transduction histidine kinase
MPIPEPVEEALYRIALEALNNSLKHAQAKNVTVFIRHTRKEILLCVRDDGLGFQVESQAHRGGMGMLSMNERVERLDGRLEIRSAPGGGCEVEAMLPLAGNKTGRSVPRRPKV